MSAAVVAGGVQGSARWRALLDATDWASLSHAYGPAEDTPVNLERLADPQWCGVGYGQLEMSVLHQGSLYSATPPAMLAAAELLSAGDAADPGEVMDLLVLFAEAVSYLEPDEAGAEEFRATLDKVQRTLLPVLDSPVGPRVAGYLTVTGRLPEDAEAALTDLAKRDDDVALAAFGALARVGCEPVEVPDWRFRMIAAWVRLLRGAEMQGDVELVAGYWDRIAELHPVIDLDLDGLPEANPAAARALYELLPESEAAARALLRVALASPSEAPAATACLARIARGATVPDFIAVYLLQQVQPTPDVCDALVATAARAEPERASEVRLSVAATLAAAGDPRWEEPLLEVLRTESRSALHVRFPMRYVPLGNAFPTTPSARLAEAVVEVLRAELSRGVVPEPSWGVESLLNWMCRWDEAEARAARPVVLAWGELLPDAVARTLTAWGEAAE